MAFNFGIPKGSVSTQSSTKIEQTIHPQRTHNQKWITWLTCWISFKNGFSHASKSWLITEQRFWYLKSNYFKLRLKHALIVI